MNKRLVDLKVRINKTTGGIDVNLPKKKFSKEELDNIQKKGSIKVLMEDLK
jgi:hypothetical protein